MPEMANTKDVPTRMGIWMRMEWSSLLEGC